MSRGRLPEWAVEQSGDSWQSFLHLAVTWFKTLVQSSMLSSRCFREKPSEETGIYSREKDCSRSRSLTNLGNTWTVSLGISGTIEGTRRRFQPAKWQSTAQKQPHTKVNQICIAQHVWWNCVDFCVSSRQMSPDLIRNSNSRWLNRK